MRTAPRTPTSEPADLAAVSSDLWSAISTMNRAVVKREETGVDADGLAKVMRRLREVAEEVDRRLAASRFHHRANRGGVALNDGTDEMTTEELAAHRRRDDRH